MILAMCYIYVGVNEKSDVKELLIRIILLITNYKTNARNKTKLPNIIKFYMHEYE